MSFVSILRDSSVLAHTQMDDDGEMTSMRVLVPPDHKCFTPDTPEVLEKLRAHLQELQEHNLIRKSKSEWEFPAAVILKKNGKIQMCVDYRVLNENTHGKGQHQVYTSAMAEDAKRSLQGAEYFSYFDLAYWYKQVDISEGDAQKTAFMTPFGLFEHLRIPFGLTNAQATLQSVVQHLFGDLMFKNSLVLFDDFLMYSGDYKQHLKDVKDIQDRVTKGNRNIHLENMRVCQTLGKWFEEHEREMQNSR